MKDITRLNEIKPLQAEGRCTIELTDPITGKVKDRVGGKNMVFPETLMVDRWWSVLDSVWTVLGDDDTPSSLDFPFMRGNGLGYGVPSTAGSGLYQGAYNPSNQFLKRQSDGKLSWKFQYDFTAPQAIGTIKSVSLTRQFVSSTYPTNFYSANSGTYQYYDGKYGYGVSADNSVTITNLYSGQTSEKDVSAVVSGSLRAIAIDKSTGKGYILASNFMLYEFSDSTFSNLINTYTISSYYDDISVYTFWCIIKGSSIYLGTSDYKIVKINYTTDTLLKSIDFPSSVWGKWSSVQGYSLKTPLHINDGCICFNHDYSDTRMTPILDINKDTVEASTHIKRNINYLINHPYASHPLPCYASGQKEVLPTAFTNYVLPTPVEKTNDKGMTVTYELDVYW